MKNLCIKPSRTAVSAAIIGLFAGSSAYAAGFSLYTEASPVAVGNFAAGSAAEAVDASTGWYNPAGLSLIHKTQMVSGGIGVFPVIKLAGNSTYTTGPLSYTQYFDDQTSAASAFIPIFHGAYPISDTVTFGLSAVSPYGLATVWDTDSPVRYQATFTELITMNVSPELGVRLNDFLAVGAGLDVQYARVKFNRMLGSPATLQFAGASPYLLDSMSYNKGKSFGFGFHAGTMILMNEDHTRFGLNYQSQMNHQFFGYSDLTGPLALNGLDLADPAAVAAAIAAEPVFSNSGLNSNEVGLPQVLTLSGYHDVNDKIAILASAVWTGWSSFKTIELDNVAAATTIGTTVVNVIVDSVSPQNYRDTWRFAVGANYKVNEKILVRVGGGYDPTPTNDVDRDVRLPDANRWALAIGGHYQMSPSIGMDFGYTHVFQASATRVNRTDAQGPGSSYNVNARANARADVVGFQGVWTMDDPTPTK